MILPNRGSSFVRMVIGMPKSQAMHKNATLLVLVYSLLPASALYKSNSKALFLICSVVMQNPSCYSLLDTKLHCFPARLFGRYYASGTLFSRTTLAIKRLTSLSASLETYSHDQQSTWNTRSIIRHEFANASWERAKLKYIFAKPSYRATKLF